jgi:hypothetical protein
MYKKLNYFFFVEDLNTGYLYIPNLKCLENAEKSLEFIKGMEEI